MSEKQALQINISSSILKICRKLFPQIKIPYLVSNYTPIKITLYMIEHLHGFISIIFKCVVLWNCYKIKYSFQIKDCLQLWFISFLIFHVVSYFLKHVLIKLLVFFVFLKLQLLQRKKFKQFPVDTLQHVVNLVEFLDEEFLIFN